MYHVNADGWTGSVPAATPAYPLKVLIVIRDLVRRERIATYLAGQDCHADTMHELPAPARFTAGSYNLVLLDAEVEPLGGFAALHRIRALSDIPIIMMRGGPSDDYDRILALEMGADDFMEEPLNAREMLARARAILRRHGAGQCLPSGHRGGFRFAGWELQRRTRRLTDPARQAVALSKNDYALLLAFLAAPQRPLSRLHLMRATRPHEDIFDRSIDVQVLRLRRKLALPGQPQLIKTDRNFGYIFDVAVEPLF